MIINDSREEKGKGESALTFGPLYLNRLFYTIENH